MTYEDAKINATKETIYNDFIVVSSDHQHYVFIKGAKKPRYYFTITRDGLNDLISVLHKVR